MENFFICFYFWSYLLYVSNVHQLDDFVLLGRSRPGAGALKAKVAGGHNRCLLLEHASTLITV